MTPPHRQAREFDLETRFQALARRPGGLPRDAALRAAQAHVETVKPHVAGWLDAELAALLRAVPAVGSAMADAAWIDAAHDHTRRLAEVAGVAGFDLVAFVAGNLCAIFEAVADGGQCHDDVVACHIDALRLARQPQYRGMSPDDLAALRDGLRRVLASQSRQPRIDGGDATLNTL
jgi:hypothetical protein